MKRASVAPGIALLIALTCLACNRDPKVAALKQGVDLMVSIAQSRVLADVVRNVDPQMHPSTAVSACLSGAIVNNFRRPPPDIGISNQGEKPTETWTVQLVADDAKKQIRIEGYGESLERPEIVRVVKFPAR
jgi:hypothetical protein